MAGSIPPSSSARRCCGRAVASRTPHTRAGGTVTDVRTDALAAAARKHSARVHLDGARLPNAAAALGVPLAALAAPVDTVALSLNKGLCAPFGALLAGDAATIAAARAHVRRLGGGTMHKAGILAAAGLVALDLVDRLSRITAARGRSPSGSGSRRRRRTSSSRSSPPRLCSSSRPATSSPSTPDGARIRLVTHRGIDDDDVARAAAAMLSIAR